MLSHFAQAPRASVLPTGRARGVRSRSGRLGNRTRPTPDRPHRASLPVAVYWAALNRTDVASTIAHSTSCRSPPNTPAARRLKLRAPAHVVVHRVDRPARRDLQMTLPRRSVSVIVTPSTSPLHDSRTTERPLDHEAIAPPGTGWLPNMTPPASVTGTAARAATTGYGQAFVDGCAHCADRAYLRRRTVPARPSSTDSTGRPSKSRRRPPQWDDERTTSARLPLSVSLGPSRTHTRPRRPKAVPRRSVSAVVGGRTKP